ncbi:uncharacterized protein LOC100369744 [Saccoglossus kowalevskii]|uniref:Uncharacterized protein LOC100369744 n=1 Tax=Saccoglossus kowalevskii TaxID=10224 RepID=A0ABM0H1F1_SACKO|nr:PREDICTED: uncharacterized protein LOC100369744 [Saccoglossus kowalevskii]
MGSGASKTQNVGFPMSPRAEFAEKHAPKGEQALMIDTPALIDLGHGTVRYRREDNPSIQPDKLRAGYFYHPRLDDYSEEARKRAEDNFKYRYVYKGPKRANDKRLFYVYGVGLKSKDQAKMVKKPYYRPKGHGYIWPSSFRKSNHVYCELCFVKQEAELSDSESEGEDLTDIEESGTKTVDNMRFSMKDVDTVESLKRRISVRLLIAVSNIHISYNELELSNDEIIGNYRNKELGTFKKFTIELQTV